MGTLRGPVFGRRHDVPGRASAGQMVQGGKGTGDAERRVVREEPRARAAGDHRCARAPRQRQHHGVVGEQTVAFLKMLKPEQICLVAAHNDDLAAARRCSFRTAFIGRPTEHGPAQTTDLGPEEDWDVIAGDLEELAGRLGL